MNYKHISFSLVLIVVLALGFLGCKADGVPENGARRDKANYSRQQAQQANQAMNSGDYEGVRAALTENFVWPPLVGENQNVQVSENLLARNYVILLDSSDSMNQRRCSGDKSKFDAAKSALHYFIEQIPPEDNIGLVVFPANVREDIVAGNRQSLLAKVDSVRAAGGTPLTEAVQAGYSMLTAQAQRQLGCGEYTLVILTDGEAANKQSLSKEVAAIVETPAIAINLYTIGFCIDGEHSLRTNGVSYNEARNPEQLTAALEGVLAEAPDFSVVDFE